MKFTKENIKKIRKAYVNGLSQGFLAKRYNVSKKTIYRIVNLQNYLFTGTIPEFYRDRLIQRQKSDRFNKKRKKPVILIGSHKRQGKDTFAEFLKEAFIEVGVCAEKYAFANAMKEIITDCLGLSLKQLDDLKNNEEWISYNGTTMTFRELLISFGNGKMKKYFGKSVWRNLTKKKFNSDCINIVSDYRFKEEYIPGAITIKVERDNSVSYCGNLTDKDFEFIIKNNGSLEDLKQEAERIVQYVLKGIK